MKRWIAIIASICAVAYGSAQAQEDHDGHTGHDHSAHEEVDDREGHGAHAEEADEHGDHSGHDHVEHAKDTADSHDDHAGHGHDDHDESVIEISQDVMREFGIEVETAAVEELNIHRVLPGEVHVNQDQTAHIVPRYPGLVVEVHKAIGDQVEKGDVLAILEGNESLATYELTSLQHGTIIDKHITRGESLSEDDVVFTVADLATVWVDLTVYQKDIAMIRRGQTVLISGGDHAPSAEGVISYVSPTIDEHTRTSLARVVLPNPDGTWRPGMFITGSVRLDRQASGVVIPREAIVSVEGRPAVFVQTNKGLEPRPVKTGITADGRIEITEGLEAGERYVSHNALPLKAELNRAALEHAGHAH